MTLRSPIFRKILLSGFALNAAALLLLDFYLSRYIARHEHEHVRQRLSTAARILADEAATVPLDRLQPWTASASARAQARVTVIDPHGRVLADSGHDPERMENHAGRPEIQAALRGGTGAAVRHSDTLGVDLYYVAAPLVYQNRGGHVLRLALPLSELKAATAEVRKGIVWASAIVAGMALLVAYIFSAHLTRRVRRLQSFAERSHAAGYGERLAPDADDELGDLARSLDRMTAQLRETIEGLNLESARRAAILSSMVEGVLAVDHSLRVTFCNEAFARAFGAALPIPERLPLLSLVRDPALLDMFTRVLVSGDVVKGRLQGFAAGDRSFEVQVTPLAAAARRGAIAILYDITDLERLERIRRDLVANVSHELRTPLAAIQGYTETLLDGALEDPAHNRAFLNTIHAHTERLSSITADLLVLSELESGKVTAPTERVGVAEAVQSAARAVEAEAALRNVTVRLDDLEGFEVLAHRLRLEQALVNLLQNAIRFNRPGGEVRVTAARANHQVQFKVSDTGIGIPSQDLPRIFERFYRVDKARSREMGGTGLGLSIVRHVVELMGGSIAVESELGRGSVFTMTLPAAPQAIFMGT